MTDAVRPDAGNLIAIAVGDLPEVRLDGLWEMAEAFQMWTGVYRPVTLELTRSVSVLDLYARARLAQRAVDVEVELAGTAGVPLILTLAVRDGEAVLGHAAVEVPPGARRTRSSTRTPGRSGPCPKSARPCAVPSAWTAPGACWRAACSGAAAPTARLRSRRRRASSSPTGSIRPWSTGSRLAAPDCWPAAAPSSRTRPSTTRPPRTTGSTARSRGTPGPAATPGPSFPDHPALTPFPHRDWCDLPFLGLLKGALPMEFEPLRPYGVEPILRNIDHYAANRNNAFLLEFGVGRVLATSLDLLDRLADDLAARHLFACLVGYLRGPALRPPRPCRPPGSSTSSPSAPTPGDPAGPRRCSSSEAPPSGSPGRTGLRRRRGRSRGGETATQTPTRSGAGHQPQPRL